MPLRISLHRTLLCSTSLGALSFSALLHTAPALAACTFAPTAGNDTYICDSGTALGLNDPGGDNSLQMPTGGTGTIDGTVVFGAGADAIVIGGGTITGNVQQGSGTDDFVMTGGVVQSLNQGDNLDTFRMDGGRIVDFFDDGDYAVMTGGRIGRVNMKLDDNTFDMSGGIIDKNLVAGFGNDTIIISNGTIGGNVSVSGGTDTFTMTGGSVGGNVLMSFGTDTVDWSGGGIVYGTVDMGAGDDIANLTNLTNANLGETDAINGGLDNDRLTLSNVTLDDVARLQNWEAIAATNDTELTLDGPLVLGDSGTGTGELTVDAASTVFAGGVNATISPFTAGQLASVVNAGRIDLTNGGPSTSDMLAINGNYTGNGGVLLLDTVLGDDTSASDKLVISEGTASGTTSIVVRNAGGAGAATVQDGILLVEAINGATTQDGAFGLGDRVAAGAYEYYLFRGGVSGGTEQNYYLRSTIVNVPAPPTPAPAPSPVDPVPEVTPEQPEAPLPPPPPATEPPPPPPTEGDAVTPPVDPTPPVDVTDPAPTTPPAPPEAEAPEPPPAPPTFPTDAAPVPGPGATPPTSGATAVQGAVVPLYRVEVPVYSVLPAISHELAMATLGTFHERRGEQILLDGAGTLSASWARVFGQSLEASWNGTVAPSFDGSIYGFQAGTDIFGWDSAGGGRNRAGLFLGYADADGDIRGQAIGWNNLQVGSLDVSATSFGGYYTHIGPSGWYVDAVLMGSWFGGNAESDAGVGIDVDGAGITASLEGGYPIAIANGWTLEPQAQLIWRHVSLDDTHDRFAAVGFDLDDGVAGRLGARLQGTYDLGGTVVQPYLKVNLWHEFDGSDTVRFDADPIVTERGGTSLEFGGGVVARMTDSVSLFATADYTTEVDGPKREVFEGNLGLSIKW